MKENQKKQNEKDLHPERYDESLFRRAYKAGVELRKLNEKERKKKLILEILGSVVGLVLVILGILYISGNRAQTYISPVAWDIQQKPIIKAPSEIYPLNNLNTEISAESVLVFNPDSGQKYFTKDIDTRRQIASLTKLVTSIIVMDNMNLDDVITVNDIPTYGEEEIWSIELEKGDQVTVENLLKMMLVSSYNDAAIVLAESFGSEEFVSLMNEKALILGLEDTSFSNPCGFDNENNYSSVSDLEKIVRVFLNYPTLTDIVKNSSAEIEYTRRGEVETKTIYTTNSLLGEENVTGIKTGSTEDAGSCLVTLFEYENGERIVIILLNSDDRYEDTERLEVDITNQLQYQ